MRYLIALAVACAVGGPSAAAALCGTPEACRQAIEANQRTTRTLSARFIQTKHLSLLTEPLTSTGRFAMRPPGEVLWELDDPHVTVRIDSDGVHIPNLPAERAEMAPFSAVFRELSGVFTGSWDRLEERFVMTVTPDATAVRIRLEPRSADWQRMFRSMELSFAQPELILTKVRLDERLGDSVEIAFSDVHRNDAVAAAAFGVPPTGEK
jgi:outer membrane lipoprotein carrier protein LolA